VFDGADNKIINIINIITITIINIINIIDEERWLKRLRKLALSVFVVAGTGALRAIDGTRLRWKRCSAGEMRRKDVLSGHDLSMVECDEYKFIPLRQRSNSSSV